MAAYSGTAGSVVYISGGSTTVGEIREWSLSLSADPVDKSAFGNSWRTHLGGLKGGEGAFAGSYDPADTPQAAMWTAFSNGTSVELRLFVGTAYYFNIGSALITGLSPTMDLEGKADIEYSFTANGAVGTASL